MLGRASKETIPVGNKEPYIYEEVVPRVYRWNYYSSRHKVDLTSHAIFINDCWFIFDPLFAGSFFDPDYPGVILLTNENHERQSSITHAVTGYSILASPDISFSVHPFPSCSFHSSGLFSDFWEAFPLDGGPMGETLFFHRQSGILVIGDAIINLPSRCLEVLPEKYCRDQLLLMRCLQRWNDQFGSLVNLALFAHGTPIHCSDKVSFSELCAQMFDANLDKLS